MSEREDIDLISNGRKREEFFQDSKNWENIISNAGISVSRFNHFGVDVCKFSAQFKTRWIKGTAEYDSLHDDPIFGQKKERVIAYCRVNPDEDYLTFTTNVSKTDILNDLKTAAKRLKEATK